ncbi:hypothetical protein KQI84_05985 [bacterium]|nr:hypothetical protein [bacterium]
MCTPIVISHDNRDIRTAAVMALLQRTRLQDWAISDAAPLLHYGGESKDAPTFLPDRQLFEDRIAWREETRKLLRAIGVGALDEVLFEQNEGHTIARYDLPAVAFGLLQRWEEDLEPRRDDHERFPAEASLLHEANLIDRPIVDEIAQALGRKLIDAGACPSLPRWGSADWAFALTFDIDSAGMYRHGGLAGSVRRLVRERGAFAGLSGLVEGLAVVSHLRSDPHENLDAIADRLGEIGIPATFFSQVFRAAPIDSYKLSDCPELVRALRRLRTRGHEVGLHGSYAAPGRDAKFLEKQRSILKSLVGGAVSSYRAHYLRQPKLEDLATAGFRFDTTAGFPRREGFRLGTAFPVQAWTNEPLPLTIVPFQAMDVTLRYHRKLDVEEAYRRAVMLLERTQAVGGLAVLLWHPHNLEPRLWPGWESLPFRLAEWAKSQGARCGTLSELAAP